MTLKPLSYTDEGLQQSLFEEWKDGKHYLPTPYQQRGAAIGKESPCMSASHLSIFPAKVKHWLPFW